MSPVMTNASGSDIHCSHANGCIESVGKAVLKHPGEFWIAYVRLDLFNDPFNCGGTKPAFRNCRPLRPEIIAAGLRGEERSRWSNSNCLQHLSPGVDAKTPPESLCRRCRRSMLSCLMRRLCLASNRLCPARRRSRRTEALPSEQEASAELDLSRTIDLAIDYAEVPVTY